jgi:hypothetical protein
LRIDMAYVRELGPHVIPAVDRYVGRHGLSASYALVQWRNRTALAHAKSMADWRSWTFRDWRLQRYLDLRSDANKAFSEAPETPGNP